MTARLQTDGLEGRFSAYRRLSGCSYSVTAEQVLESERKLKLLSVLKVKSSKFGELRLTDFTAKINKDIAKPLVDNLDNVESAVYEISDISVPLETRQILICIASYTSKSLIETFKEIKNCLECSLMLQSNEEMELVCDKEIFCYFTELNRGGLKRPSIFMITLCENMYRLFQVLISDKYESEFLKLSNQRKAFITLGVQLSEIVCDLDQICQCGLTFKILVKKCIKIMSNIFINNYTKLLNEVNVSRKLARKYSLQKDKGENEIGDKVNQRKILKFSKA